MKRGGWVVAAVAASVLQFACSNDQDAGRRFRAERDLWHADQDYRQLTVRPRDVKKEQWLALARRYEEIAERHEQGLGSPGSGAASREGVHAVAARALFTAAQLYGGNGDSTRVDQIFERMATHFAGVPAVAGEVALAQGRIAESRGQLGKAADLYQAVVDRVKPDPQNAGAAGVVVNLPIMVARLRTQAAGATPATGGHPYYDAARAYYERTARESEEVRTRFEAQARLADIAADQGDWSGALAAMRTLEEQLKATDSPPRDPAEVRMSMAVIQARATGSPEQAQATLASILSDYPNSPILPQVLHSLALNAQERGEVGEALGYLDRLSTEYKDNTQAVAQALLTRARILESRNRWGEALDAYRSVTAQYPLTEPALAAPLEIAAHYNRVQDEAAATMALEQAAQHYRDFVTKYPPGPLTGLAREQLAKALTLQEKYDEAITELVSLGADTAPSRGSVALLTAAAGLAYREMSDSLKAAEILERMGKAYDGSEIGVWATKEAARLRGASQP